MRDLIKSYIGSQSNILAQGGSILLLYVKKAIWHLLYAGRDGQMNKILVGLNFISLGPHRSNYSLSMVLS